VIIIAENREFENRWNVTQWWTENQDFDHKVNDLKFINIRQQSLDFRYYAPDGNARPDYYMPPGLNENSNNSDLIDSLESYDGSDSVIPRSSTQSISDTLYNYFTHIRSYRGDRRHFKEVKRNLRKKFLEMGLNTALHSFWPPEIVS